MIPACRLRTTADGLAIAIVEKRQGTRVAYISDMGLRQTLKVLLSLLFLLAAAGIVGAQSDERVYEELDFRFVTPGARAVAMGKTFVGLADDATAAYSNPAGLSNLMEPEFSFEYTGTQIKHHRFIPSVDGETLQFGNRVYAPTFLSYAYPSKSFTFLVFRNVVQNYEENFSFRGRFIPALDRPENGSFGSIDIESVNYGFGLSYLINPSLSVGASAVLSTLDVHIHSRNGILDPINGSDTNGSDQAPSVILGVLYKPYSKLSIGSVYNTGSKFGLDEVLYGLFPIPGPNPILTGVKKRVDFVIPDRFAIGTSYKLSDSCTVNFDVSRIFYSQQITRNFFITPENFDPQLKRENFYINDITEIHSGAEYRFYQRRFTWAIRAGLFTDPDHQLHFRNLPGTNPLGAAVETFRFNSLPQHTDVGATFGGGIAISNRVQFDVAFSHSRDTDDGVVSVVVKF